MTRTHGSLALAVQLNGMRPVLKTSTKCLPRVNESNLGSRSGFLSPAGAHLLVSAASAARLRAGLAAIAAVCPSTAMPQATPPPAPTFAVAGISNVSDPPRPL